MNFASDNTSGVCPEVLKAIADEAERFGPAYGADDRTAELTDALAEVFEHEVAVFPVATGTAANSISLASLNPPWGGVICHDDSHISVDELAAPSAMGGGLTLFQIEGTDGRLDATTVDDSFVRRDNGVHTVPFTAISVTQATESGTTYSVDDLAALGALARRRDLAFHMDGARFANAVAGSAASPAESTWRVGVDVLSLGATKGGALGAEAIVVFDPARRETFERHRKRFGHLLSKQRFAAAQLLGWLGDDAWLRHAGHANDLAERLGEGLAAAGADLMHPVEANMVFVSLTPDQVAALHDAGAAFYATALGGGRLEGRFVTSWSSTVDEVDELVRAAERVISS